MAALLLCGLVLVCAQGSLTIIAHKPAADGQATPTRGANVVAIGPLFRARDGQREVQAFRFEA